MANSSLRPTRKSSVYAYLAGALVACAMLGGPQIADANGTVSIWAKDSTSDPWQLLGTASGTSPSVVGGVPAVTTTGGTFSLFVSSASMTQTAAADLASSNLTISHIGNGTDTLLLAVVAQGFASPTVPPISLASAASANAFTGVTAVSFQSYVDSSNNGNAITNPMDLPLLLGGQGLQTGVINPATPTSSATISFPGLFETINSPLTAPFAVSELYTLEMSGPGAVVSLGGETYLSSQFGTGPGTPEPTSMALLGVGIAGMAGYGWRRRRNQPTTDSSLI
jgi:PEP-CTERM motif